MEIAFDPRKNERNIRERGLSFERAADFDFETAQISIEYRHSESRRVAIGYLDKRLHMLCYLPLEHGIPVISFRRINDREVRKYGRPKTIDG